MMGRIKFGGKTVKGIVHGIPQKNSLKDSLKLIPSKKFSERKYRMWTMTKCKGTGCSQRVRKKETYTFL